MEIDEDTKQQMREHFDTVALHQLLGLELEDLGERHAVFSMPVDTPAFGSTGNLHGGAVATLIDVAAGSAAAVASGFDPERETLVTADLHVRYLGRPRHDTVYARAEVLHTGRTLVIVAITVTDGDGHLIASADFSSMVVRRRQALTDLASGGDSPA